MTESTIEVHNVGENVVDTNSDSAIKRLPIQIECVLSLTYFTALLFVALACILSHKPPAANTGKLRRQKVSMIYGASYRLFAASRRIDNDSA